MIGIFNAETPAQGRVSMGSVPIALCGLVASLLGLAVLSSAFPYGAAIADTPWAAYVVLGTLSGAVFLWMVSSLPSQAPTQRLLIVIFLAGLAARLAMFGSTPVFEDDWYRYLWDGAAVANGIDPYAFPPASAAPVDAFGTPRPLASDPDLARLQTLAMDAQQIHERINFPYLSTIYPPLAQAGFGLSHIISPYSLTAWRGLLLVADLAGFLVLLQILRRMGRSPLWSAAYWLNPLVIVQVFGAGHMDGLLVPFLLAAIWMGLANRPGLTGAALAGAVGVKLWPLILFPALAMRFWRSGSGTFWFTTVFGLLVALLLAPQALRAIQPDDGLGAYSSSWQTHAFLFPLISDGLFGWLDGGDSLTRLLVAGAVSIAALGTAMRLGRDDDIGLVRAVLLVIGTLIFLSPTGYPWYVVWAAPLLAIVPNRGLLLLALTAPLYHLRFVLGDDDAVYLWLVVPAAFLPALILFVRDSLHTEAMP
ncbi:MAG: glycosyltransferase 87 family protein [Pseudomonadota bacterium]